MDRQARVHAAHEYLLKAETAYLQAMRLLPKDIQEMLWSGEPRYANIVALRVYLEHFEGDLLPFHQQKIDNSAPLPYDLGELLGKEGQ